MIYKDRLNYVLLKFDTQFLGENTKFYSRLNFYVYGMYDHVSLR